MTTYGWHEVGVGEMVGGDTAMEYREPPHRASVSPARIEHTYRRMGVVDTSADVSFLFSGLCATSASDSKTDLLGKTKMYEWGSPQNGLVFFCQMRVGIEVVESKPHERIGVAVWPLFITARRMGGSKSVAELVGQSTNPSVFAAWPIATLLVIQRVNESV